jgi:hypothetical protein
VQARVNSLTKTDKKSVLAVQKDDVGETRDAFLTEGYSKFPVIPYKGKTAADFYRRGQLLNAGSPSTAADFTQLPRLIDDPAEEEPASIRLFGKKKVGSTVADEDLIPPFSKFFLESVQESRNERSQVVETFGNFYVFFFGERPPVYTFSGTLLNTDNTNWVEDYMFYYENFLRGTRCVEIGAKLVITYGYHQIEGYLMGTSLATQAVNERGVAMNFQVLVIDRKIMKLSLDFGLIESDGGFKQDVSFLDVLTRGMSDPSVSAARERVEAVMNKDKPPSQSEVAKAVSQPQLAIDFPKIELEKTARGTLQKVGIV